MRISKTTKLVITFFVLACNCNLIYAQKAKPIQTITEIVTGLENVQSIQQMVDMRNKMTKSVGDVKQLYQSGSIKIDQVQKTAEQYNLLQLHYNQVFDEIKRDLIVTLDKTNYKQIQNKYNSKVSSLNSEYTNYDQSITSLTSNSKAVGIMAGSIIGTISDLITLITTSIQQKKLNRESLHTTFNDLSPMLFKKFYMPEWNELWPEYSLLRTSNPQTSQSTSNSDTLSNHMPSTKVEKKTNMGLQRLSVNETFSAPYFKEVPNADIKVLNAHPDTKTLTDVKLDVGFQNKNVKQYKSVQSYPTGALFSIEVNTKQFIYFFALNDGKLELLCPIIKSKNTTVEMEENRSDYTYNQKESGITLPERGFFKIDEKGSAEKWVVVISNSEIFNANAFASQYLKIPTNTKNTIVSTEFDQNEFVKDPNDGSQYLLNSILEIYDITITKN